MSHFSTVPFQRIAVGWCSFVLVGTLAFPGGVLLRSAVCDDRQDRSGEKSTTASGDEKPGNLVPVPAPEKIAAKTPELVYMTWQKSKNADGKRALNTLWDVKGEIVPDEEAKKAVIATNSFNVHWWHPEEELRPLVLIFRVDPTFASYVNIVTIDDRGRRHAVGTFSAGKIRGWSVSAVAPSKRGLAEWPKEISLEIKYPIEKARLLKTIDEFPDATVAIAEGVEWSVEDNRGLRDQKPAAVLRCQRGRGDWELHKYDVKCYVRGKKEPLAEAYATRFDDAKAAKEYELRVSTSIENRHDIEKIEVWRQRNDITRIDEIPVRLDLQPRDEPSDQK